MFFSSPSQKSLQELAGIEDLANFRTAVKQTSPWLRRMPRRSLMLALKDLQSLSQDVELSEKTLDGPEQIDIVNNPAPSKFVVNNYEMADYFKM